MERKPQPADSRLRLIEWLDAVQGRVAEASVYRFCQLLECAAPGHPPLGSSEDPADDLVRFRPDPGMGFPASELKALEWPTTDEGLPATVRTRLLGLYGVDSPLPTRYLDDIAQKREGHEALEGFLDIFNHRVFTQFYRIWRKYSYPASFAPAGADPTSQCLFGLIGLGIPGTAKRIATPLSRFLALLGVMRLPKGGATTLTTPATPIPPGYAAGYTLSEPDKGYAPFARYLITTQEGERFPGVTDKDGRTIPVHTLLPGNVVIEFPNDKHDEQ